MKKAVTLLSMIFLMVLVAPCFADDIQGTIVTNKSFVSKEYLVLQSGIKITLYSTESIDLSLLLTHVENEVDMEIVKQKIDNKRSKLFPDAEIILAVVPPEGETEKLAASGIQLIKAIYWWNNENCYGCYWYAYYNCHAADMFTQISAGVYYINRNVNGSWVHYYTLQPGQAASIADYGGYGVKGFLGMGATGYNMANVVMYFYNAY